MHACIASCHTRQTHAADTHGRHTRYMLTNCSLMLANVASIFCVPTRQSFTLSRRKHGRFDELFFLETPRADDGLARLRTTRKLDFALPGRSRATAGVVPAEILLLLCRHGIVFGTVNSILVGSDCERSIFTPSSSPASEQL